MRDLCKHFESQFIWIKKKKVRRPYSLSAVVACAFEACRVVIVPSLLTDGMKENDRDDDEMKSFNEDIVCSHG